MKSSYFIFSISGGAGKNVLATAVIKAIKKSYPEKKIIILTAFKDVWLYNPNIYRVYQHGQTPNFYKDFIQNKDVQICASEPYLTNDYILKKKHLIEIWCDLAGVPYNNEKPELFFNQREIEYSENLRGLNQAPIFVIQTNGGVQQDVKVSWMRDMPIGLAQSIINDLAGRFRVIHIRRDDQPALQGAEQFKGSLREMMVLIRYSKRRLLIDSVSQHIAAALDKKSTILWVRNNPSVLGYAMHDNIITEVEDELDSISDGLFEPYDITGNIYQCPFKEGTQLFDKNVILKSISLQGEKEAVATKE